MDLEKVLIVTRVDLIPWGNNKFYACVIPEEGSQFPYGVWVFWEGWETSYQVYNVTKDHLEIVSTDHIKELDQIGYFDGVKENFLREYYTQFDT